LPTFPSLSQSPFAVRPLVAAGDHEDFVGAYLAKPTPVQPLLMSDARRA
jgi:hypothetical protein